ncbi:MAG: hypothetical protein K2H19_04270, partial [Ruminococcus sp.]|nr:hypothetical protein [Ruminococcus sp.]
MEINLFSELQTMRENFKADLNKKIKLPKIDWLKVDLLGDIYKSADVLLKKGNVYYSAIIQANKLLFKRFPCWDCPMEIIYSTDDFINENPYLLHETAHYIYSFKNSTEAPPPIKVIVDSISDEYQRNFNVPVVMKDIFESDQDEINKAILYCNTVMVFRKYIPKKTLKGNIVPIIAAHYECRSIIILPEKYWTDNFI